MYQSLQLVGNLGRNPEMRYMPDGTAVTNFSVAVSKKWKGQDGEAHDDTTWFNISVFGKAGEACNQYLAKGSKVLVVGTLKTPKPYMNKQGEPACSLEVTANQVQFLDSRNQSESQTDTTPVQEEEDDIPF